jgi:sugar phosphate isomerase/epimerase
MQLAYTTLACPDWDWQAAINAARDYGYDGVEWRLVDGEVVTREFPLETALRISEAVTRAGLQTCALDSSVRLTLPPGPERDAQIEDAHGMLRVARAFGARMMRVFPGVYPETVTDVEATGWVIEGLQSLIPTAREEGVQIALETHDKFGWPRKATRGTTTSSFLKQVLSQVQAPEVGVQWDIANPYNEGETADATWKNIKDHLAYVHLKDMRQSPDGSWQYVPTGEGVMPITDAIDWLRAYGFDGWVSFEWEKKWHPELAEPEQVLPHFVTYMRKLLGT